MAPNRQWTVYLTINGKVAEHVATARFKEEAVGVALQSLWRSRPSTAVTDARAVTVCKYGHPMEGDNLRISSQGSRQCRACDRAACKASYRRNGKLLPSGKRIAPKGDIFEWYKNNAP